MFFLSHETILEHSARKNAMPKTKSRNRKDFDAQQIEFAVQKYKSHSCIGSVSKVLEAIRLQEAHSAALMIF